MKESERELLIRIDERVEVNSHVLKHLHDKVDHLGSEYVKKNEISHILTAYYIISRMIIIGVMGSLLALIGYHVK